MTPRNRHNLKPCFHMETLASAWLDEMLTGIPLRYTQWHVAHCPRCADALSTLRALRIRLGRLADPPPDSPPPSLTPARRDTLRADWERTDRASGPP